MRRWLWPEGMLLLGLFWLAHHAKSLFDLEKRDAEGEGRGLVKQGSVRKDTERIWVFGNAITMFENKSHSEAPS